MTEHCRFYSGEERLSDRWGAADMLEKAEPRDRVYTGEVCQDETVSFNMRARIAVLWGKSEEATSAIP